MAYYHYDFYSQALAKIEPRLMRHFEEIEPLLYRFPAIDPASFRRAVERVCKAEAPQQTS